VSRHRFDQSRLALQTPALDDRQFRRSFEDEVAIDFPSAQSAIECVTRDLVDADTIEAVSAQIVIDRSQARAGARVPLSLRVRHTCGACGGRGETWGERCGDCVGEGHALSPLQVEVRVPPGTADGDSVRFVVTPRRGPRTRVDVRLAVS
jgi:hypothetical protein